MCLCQAYANPGTVQVTSYPTLALADGRSMVNITAEVRDSSGRLVPDGTQVVFGTTIGTLRDTVVETHSGFARTVLISGSEPGIAKITASVLSFQTNSSLDFEFVKDKALLTSLKDFIELSSSRRIRYVPELKIMETSAKGHGVKLFFRDIELEADSLQLKVPTYEVRAKNAKLKVYGKTLDFNELYFILNRKQGYGLGPGDEPYHQYIPAYPYGSWKTKTRRRNVIQGIAGGEVKPLPSPIAGSVFDFADLTYGSSEVLASHAVVYPARDIYLQRAEIEVQGRRLLSVQYYRIPVYADVPVLGDQVISLTGSQVSLNYPYYLNLKPGFNSLLRFRSGTAYAGGGGVGGGNFMDYEMNWSKGSQSDGGLTLSSLGRKDMGVSARQFVRLDDKTSVSAQAQMPTNRSFYTGVQFNRQIGMANLNYSGSYTKSLKGLTYRNMFQTLGLENMPVAIKKTPFQFTYGLTAQQTEYKTDSSHGSQNLLGLRTRLNSNAIPLNKVSNLMTSISLTRRIGTQAGRGLAVQGNMSVNTRLGRNASAYLHYDFLDDDFLSRDLGKHQVGGSFNYDKGPFSLSFFGTKSLDVNRHNVTTNASYMVGPYWHLSGYFSRDVFRSSQFDELTYILGYRIGGAREVGVSWSSRTKRLGLEVFGAAF